VYRTFLILILLDQVTKAIVPRGFLVLNSNLPHLFLVSGFLAVLLGYFYLERKALDPKFSLGLVLIFAGAISNLLDRIFFDSVRDFLDFALFRANVADLYIILGIAIVVSNPGDYNKST